MKKIRFAIIGCGRISKKHILALQALSADVELVAVCDQNLEKAEKTAKEIGARAYADYHEMIRREKPDAVNILTWSGNHAAVALDCAPHVPNIIVEKPMALRLSDADQMIEACRRHDSRLFIVKQNRYNPPVVKLKKAIDQGRFGKLLLGTIRVRWMRTPEYYKQDPWRGTWAYDGGVLTNQASHHVDLLLWLMGPAESVYAKTATFLAPVETEDTGVAVLKFKSGALGVIEATTCARPNDLEGSVTILGEKGSVEIAGFAVNQVRTWKFVENLPEDDAARATSTQPPDVYGFGHLDFLREVVHTIRTGSSPVVDGSEGRRSLELIHSIYESAALHKEIPLEGFVPSKSRLGEPPKNGALSP